jgi:hypothetical protein
MSLLEIKYSKSPEAIEYLGFLLESQEETIQKILPAAPKGKPRRNYPKNPACRAEALA